MLGRPRAVTSPSNESVAAVPVFTPDPHGAAMFAGITNGTLGHLGSRVVLDTGGKAWHGWVQSPQAPMRDGGNLGSARPVVSQTSRLDQEHGVTPDSIQTMFEQRMGARRFS
jgi:hypothetical protein